MTDPFAIDRRQYSRDMLVVFLGAVVLRLLYVMLWQKGLPPDTDSYRQIAENLISGKDFSLALGVPTAYRAPLYPLFVAAVELFFHNPLALMVAQAVASASIVFLAARLARNIVGDLFSLAAAALVAVDPYGIAVSGQLMTEAFFSLLVTVAVVALVWAMRTNSLSRYAAAGLAAGAAAITRPEFLAFAPGAVVVAAIWGRPRRRLLSALAFLVAMALLPAAWGVRNDRALGRWVFTTTHGGYTHRLAYNSVFYDKVVAGPDDVWNPEDLASWQKRLVDESEGMSEVSRDRLNYRMASGFVDADKRRALRVALYEVSSFWRPYPHGASRVVSAGMALFFAGLVVLAIVGVYVAWRRSAVAPLVVCILLAETLIHAYYWSNVRMRIPFDPLLAVLAAVGLATLFGRRLIIGEPAKAAREGTLYSPAV